MRRRVLAALVAVTAFAVGAFFVPAAIAIRSTQQRGALLDLQREASIVASQLSSLDSSEDALALELLQSSGHRFGLYAIDGSLVAGVGPRVGDDVVQLALAGNFAERYVGDDLVAAEPVRVAPLGAAFVIRIEEPRSQIRAKVIRSLLLLGLAGLAVIGVAALVGRRLARRLNRPVEELTAWASSGRPVEAAPAATGVIELDELRSALLEDRTRIDGLLARERSFSSQVSHQLRTPVAAMRVVIETELAAPRDDAQIVLTESLGQLDRLESTINSLLALARQTERRLTSCDVFALVRERVGEWMPRVTPHGRSIAAIGNTVTADADVDAIGHIIDVVVENALVHGRGDIAVEVGRGPDSVWVDVRDRGVAPHDVDPFAEHGAESSHGIGLRLARALAESSGGRLELLDSPTTTFRLSLPG
jgi:signal transduction histidine kinase